MASIDGLEINLPGDTVAPFDWSIDYVARLLDASEIYIQKSVDLLKEFSNPSGEWVPDCLVVADDPGEQGAGFQYEFSNESDPYGLWWVEYKALGEPEIGAIRRNAR